MKGKINNLTLKYGISPVSIQEMSQTIYKNDSCILVYDENNCVGMVFEHYESRKASANGQAEIRFFDKFKNEYRTWHRIFINGQRVSYASLADKLNFIQSIEYYCHIKA